jgi:CRP-like cAMP-binding protein
MARSLLESDDGNRIETTRRILGESAGTTVETAIRVLRRFEQKGWLEGGVGWVRVLDRGALETIARGGESEREG